jgi:hypothetical protein
MNSRLRVVVTIAACLLGAHTAVASGTAAAAGASEADETIRVLVPVLADRLPGANGSVWETELWLSNTSQLPILFVLSPCNIACCCAETNTYSPQSTTLITLDAPHGKWFDLPSDGSLQLHARLRDLSRASSSAGVELQLVRYGDFRADQLNLIAVPRDPRFRVTVRLYGMTAGTALRVEQVDLNGVVLGSQDVSLDPPAEAFGGTIPAYAQISLPSAAASANPVRIRITPRSQGARFWSFATVTNNESSEVTVIRPTW